jgi:hypothetical protein
VVLLCEALLRRQVKAEWRCNRREILRRCAPLDDGQKIDKTLKAKSKAKAKSKSAQLKLAATGGLTCALHCDTVAPQLLFLISLAE